MEFCNEICGAVFAITETGIQATPLFVILTRRHRKLLRHIHFFFIAGSFQGAGSGAVALKPK